MGLPTGSGMFIWQLPRLGSPKNVADLCEAAGFSWVTLKLTDGAYVSHGNLPSDFDKIEPEKYVEELKKKNIRVHGWGYTYGNRYKQGPRQFELEFKAIMQAVRRFELDTWCIDAEQEIKTETTPVNQTAAFLDAVISGLDIPVGYTSYRFPTLHPEFPWELFTTKCEFSMPQVYWLGANNPGEQMRRCVKEYAKYKQTPMFPVGFAYADGVYKPTLAEIREFYLTVKDLGLGAWSWWECYYALKHSDWWNEITSYGTLKVTEPETGLGLQEKMYTIIKEINSGLNKIGSDLSTLKELVKEVKND